MLAGFETSPLAPTPKIPGRRRDLAVENPAPGNGIFGCRDGRLKSGVKDRNVTRDRTSAMIPAKIPTETAFPERAPRFAVSQVWIVGAPWLQPVPRWLSVGGSYNPVAV